MYVEDIRGEMIREVVVQIGGRKRGRDDEREALVRL